MEELLYKRLSAKLIDLCLINILALLVELKFPNTSKLHLSIIFFIIYEVIILYKYDTTLGKFLFKLKVLNHDNTKLTLLQHFMRTSLSLVSINLLGLGILYAFFEKQKRTAHDKILKTQIANIN
ncbi:hypothetical protein C0V70_07890 [Bacteriovorax stolpii]|uniref:RDD domain-containing protein n=1 Tax=Bacteriovorax stolpii TaxID=960 RepID=A0A2K9NR90_BACTC|nr:RDD family protein [Bacteriovorax stolpii]AUN98029.1 hypothetical protein C0V70_07890 [Bacteriovorax stolpii]TDP50281.1 putative RDD family membrane protein YckC [Bacteriovorax stolpii]